MSHDFDDLSLPPRPDFAIQSLTQIQAARHQFPPPSFISDTVIPKVLAGEWADWVHGVSHETSGRVRVHCQEEWDEQMVRVPESLIALLPDLRMRCGVHQQHAQ